MAKRIQFSATGGPEVLQYVDFQPQDPAAGEVQVENKAIGINYIDTYMRSGLYPTASLPSGLGTEAAGVVSKIGSTVTGIKVGDRVVYAQSALGAYSEIHNVPQEKIALLPNAISFEQAAASFLKGLTVYYLLRLTHNVKAGETFLFHAAAGGVGLIACQWAKALGAHLIGTVGSGEKVGVVYDSVGKDTFERSLDSLKPRGLLVSFGNASGPVKDVDLAILNKKGSLFVTRPSLNGYVTTREELKTASDELFSMIASGAIKVDVSEAQKFPLSEARRAHEMLESRSTQGSSLLIPGK